MHPQKYILLPIQSVSLEETDINVKNRNQSKEDNWNSRVLSRHLL